MAELTEKEMLLLSNLMYCPDGITAGDTVEEIVTGLEIAIDNGKAPNLDGAFDGESFKEMINYIKGDPKLMSLTVTDATPSYSDVRAACFVDDEGKATVAFEGTGGTQIAWSDDVKGENISDTACQSQAALFVKEMSSKYGPVDVTGHSKGGNMAMYSAIVCPGVANCISFDGQGFSEEFYAKYSDEVSANSGRIKNICAYNDFVNILMPSPGEKVYLQNPVNKFTERHYSSKLFINNFNGNYGNFGEGELISESQVLNIADGDKNIFKKSLANAPQLYTFVRNTAASGIIQTIRNGLDFLPPREHQLFVDVASIAVSGLLASGDYSFGEMIGDLGTAIGKYLGFIKKYTNASYSLNASAIDGFAQRLGGWEKELSGYKGELNELYEGLQPTSPSLYVNKFLLKKAVDNIEDMVRKTGKLAQGLYGAKQLYAATESTLAELAESMAQ